MISKTNKEFVLQRLIELKLSSDIDDAEDWINTYKIPSFDNKTALELIQEGRIEALLDEIQRIASGGYT